MKESSSYSEKPSTTYIVEKLGTSDDLLPQPNLGDEKIEKELSRLLEKFSNEAQGDKYLVRWTGLGRIPRTQVGGHHISWTQHGIVKNDKGEMVGSYERIQDGSGPNHNENAMLIVFWKKD